MTVTATYLQRCNEIIETIKEQQPQIDQAATWFAESILAGRVVHLFGTGHSRIMIEEMWPRYGSFPGFNPIVELSLTYHNNVTGANGQRQAMFLENVSGLAEKILRNFSLSERDCALIVSSSGCNNVPIEIAEIFRKERIKTVALVTKAHSEQSKSKRIDGKKLTDFADIVLDTGAPVGDAMIYIDGLETPVSPGSTVGGSIIINCIKAEVAKRLTEAGKPPLVLTAAAIVGTEKATNLFEAAYDEHAQLMSVLFNEVGKPKKVSK